MKRIYKYKIDKYVTCLEMPIDAKILTVDSQEGINYLWAIVETSRETETRRFTIYGTGHNLSDTILDNQKYIGTINIRDGFLMWHIFEFLN